MIKIVHKGMQSNTTHKFLLCPVHLSNHVSPFTDAVPADSLTPGWLTPAGRVLPSGAMSAKAISEQTGKEFLYKHISASAGVQNRFRYAYVTPETDWDRLTQDHPWLLTEVSPSLTDTPVPRLSQLVRICRRCQ